MPELLFNYSIGLSMQAELLTKLDRPIKIPTGKQTCGAGM
jgi:hypothetical protein